jgi:acyl-CoA synthetase (NDP forming)
MPTPHRPVYRHKDLERLLNPASIAVYGVSPNPTSMGAKGYANLKTFSGKSFRINARYAEMNGEVCYPSVKACPQVPDCVLIALPRVAVEAAVLECAEAGVGGVVIFASGYHETGLPERTAEQDRLTAIARETGLKIVGPNTMGLANLTSGAIVSFMSGEMPRGAIGAKGQPGIGVISQSGAMGFGLIQGTNRGIAMSHVLTMGNACDFNVNDAIAYLAEDPGCRAIACLFEAMSDPEQLFEAGEIAWKNDKPVVMCKMGVSEQGAAAALSHTGSLAGSEAAYRAAAERAGIIMLDNLEALLETTAFFAKAPRRPKSRGVAVMSSSGGAGIISADVATKHGVALPQPRPEVAEKLKAIIPDFVKPKNPLDITAMVSGNVELTNTTFELLAGCGDYGLIIYPTVGTNARTVERLPAFSEISGRHGVPVCQPLLGGWVGGPGQKEAAADPYMVPFISLDACFSAIAAWHKRDDKRLAFEKHGPRKLARLSPADAKDKAARLIGASKNKALTEREAKAVLACYGVPVVGEQLVQSSEEAVKAAASLGYPVAMKVESPDIPHKTEAGVIRLNLKTAEEVEAAYDAVMANARKYKADAKLNGVLVQPMAPAGTEIMVGGRVDPLFGPLIVAGLGGVLVELMKDTALDLAPINQREATAMLGRLKAQAALNGFRGAEPVDRDKLGDIIVRLSEFIADQKDLVAELDVNPLICAGSRIVAVDALIVRA